MAFLAKLAFGYFAEFRSDWKAVTPAYPPSETLVLAFAREGVTLLSSCYENRRLRLVVEIEDQVAPTFLTQRLKGRFAHVLRNAPEAFPGFSPHFYLRTLGQNTREVVNHYIREQVDRSDLVDPLYRERLKKLRFQEEGGLSVHKTRHRGVYDLFVHLVLVTGGRYRMASGEAERVFVALGEAARGLAADPLEISMMPDHAHLLLRWPEKLSANELLEGVKRESGRLFGRSAFWNNGGYVGTVGPYSLNKALNQNRADGGWRSVPRRR
ncbi:MAG: transposase [Opitutales bacterium]|nr:transposase [Opitutales bacterium]